VLLTSCDTLFYPTQPPDNPTYQISTWPIPSISTLLTVVISRVLIFWYYRKDVADLQRTATGELYHEVLDFFLINDCYNRIRFLSIWMCINVKKYFCSCHHSEIAIWASLHLLKSKRPNKGTQEVHPKKQNQGTDAQYLSEHVRWGHESGRGDSKSLAEPHDTIPRCGAVSGDMPTCLCGLNVRRLRQDGPQGTMPGPM
jgi:hypothetical protein